MAQEEQSLMHSRAYVVGVLAALSFPSVAKADSEVVTRTATFSGHRTLFVGQLPLGVQNLEVSLYVDHKAVGATEIVHPDPYEHPWLQSVSVAGAYGVGIKVTVPTVGPVIVEARSKKRHRVGVIVQWALGS